MPTLQFIPSTTAGGIIPMDDIPQSVRDEMEEAYKVLSNSDGRLRATFESEADAKVYARQAASYCKQRPSGVLRFRISPTKGLPKNVFDFRVTADLEENGQKKAKES